MCQFFPTCDYNTILSFTRKINMSLPSSMSYKLGCVRSCWEIVSSMQVLLAIWINSRHLVIVTATIVSFRSRSYLCAYNSDATIKTINSRRGKQSRKGTDQFYFCFVLIRWYLRSNSTYSLFSRKIMRQPLVTRRIILLPPVISGKYINMQNYI